MTIDIKFDKAPFFVTSRDWLRLLGGLGPQIVFTPDGLKALGQGEQSFLFFARRDPQSESLICPGAISWQGSSRELALRRRLHAERSEQILREFTTPGMAKLAANGDPAFATIAFTFSVADVEVTPGLDPAGFGEDFQPPTLVSTKMTT